MANSAPLPRRAFLKLAGLQLAAFALPWDKAFASSFGAIQPRLRLEDLPARLLSILTRISQLQVSPDGYLFIVSQPKGELNQMPLTPTEFNRENSKPWHKLETQLPWGIVLHWFGDDQNYDRSVTGYLRGFDSLREINGEEIRTSAHFLVGPDDPSKPAALEGRAIALLQTQFPAQDGIPFMASHLQSLDYLGHKHGQQYFVKALDRLALEGSFKRHLIQDLYKGKQIDPNRRTIGIEITGNRFDSLEGMPTDQQIANVVSLVRALMIRYRIPSNALLGHHELQLGKADPGKNFLALIRFLIGVLALSEDDPLFYALVFGPFETENENPIWAVRRYFKFVRDYLVLTSIPKHVYEWEANSNYWLLTDLLPGATRGLPVASKVISPLSCETALRGQIFLRPNSHEGVDLYSTTSARQQPPLPVNLSTDGICLYAGEASHLHGSYRAIFRHRQPDGAEILTVYDHLGQMQTLTPGLLYPAGYRLGITEQLTPSHDTFLHFAIAYGSAWETALHNHPEIPLNAGQTWIRQHFMDPLFYDFKQFLPLESTDPQRKLFE